MKGRLFNCVSRDQWRVVKTLIRHMAGIIIKSTIMFDALNNGIHLLRTHEAFKLNWASELVLEGLRNGDFVWARNSQLRLEQPLPYHYFVIALTSQGMCTGQGCDAADLSTHIYTFVRRNWLERGLETLENLGLYFGWFVLCHLTKRNSEVKIFETKLTTAIVFSLR